MYVAVIVSMYSSADCIKLITSNSDIPSTTNAVTTITATTTTTTATLTTINATVTTASVMTSSSVSGATKSQDSEGLCSVLLYCINSACTTYICTISFIERLAKSVAITVCSEFMYIRKT